MVRFKGISRAAKRELIEKAKANVPIRL
jgi:hypothetical protein